MATRKIQAFKFSTSRHLGLMPPAFDERLLQSVAGVFEVADQVIQRTEKFGLMLVQTPLPASSPRSAAAALRDWRTASRAGWVTLMPSQG